MKHGIKLTALALVALAVTTLAGCRWFIEAILEPYVYVEQENGDGIEGIEVYLYGSEADAQAAVNSGSYSVGARKSGTTNINGYVGFGELDEGNYWVVAVDTNTWDFPDFLAVDMKEKSQFMGTIIGRGFLGISGTVLDVKSSGGAASISLELWNDSGVQVGSTVSGTGGTFSFAQIDPGDYTIRGSGTGFAVIDEPVTVSGSSASGVDVIAFSYDASSDLDPYVISIILLWDDAFQNVNAHITHPNGWKGAEQSIDGPLDMTVTAGNGFLPDEVTGREEVYSANIASLNSLDDVASGVYQDGSLAAVEMINALNDGGPETILVREIPVDWFSILGSASGNYLIAPDSATNLLPNGATYAWVGTSNYYVHGVSGNLMNEGESAFTSGANLEAFVVQGDNVLGRYTLPEYTTIRAAQLFRINLFGARADDGSGPYSFFQIVPSVELIPATSTFSPASADDTPQVINVRGRRMTD